MIREYIIKVDDTKTDIMGGTPLEEPPKELIRCKDCKKEVWCRRHWNKDEDWYCADGERKEGNGDDNMD